MTYRTEQDENGEEVLDMVAIVHDGIVDCDWLHSDENVEGFEQRLLAKRHALMGSNNALPSQAAVFTLRLYRRGDVSVSGVTCDDGYREQAIQLATAAALDMYDLVFPDVAREARAYVHESVEKVKRIAAVDMLPLPEAGAIQEENTPCSHRRSSTFYRIRFHQVPRWCRTSFRHGVVITG